MKRCILLVLVFSLIAGTSYAEIADRDRPLDTDGSIYAGFSEGNEPSKSQLMEYIKKLQAQVSALAAKVDKLEGKPVKPPVKEAVKKKPPAKRDVAAKVKDELEKLDIGACATMIVQNAIDANRTPNNKENKTAGSYQIDIMLDRDIGEFGHAFAQLECGDGLSVIPDLEVFSNVDNNNDDTDNRAWLTKFWYQQKFLDRQLALTIGKWDPTDYVDTNAYANNDSMQFLGSIFNNAPTWDVPSKAPGAMINVQPHETPWFEFMVQAFTGDGSWDNILDHMEITPELNIKPTISGRTGNYRVYGWLRNTYYTQWSDRSKTKEHGYGFGVTIDQEITDIIGVFGRYGWENPDVYDPDNISSAGTVISLEQTWSAGFQVTGKPWGREKDNIGCAVGWVMPSDKYKEYGGSNLEAKDEGHFEIYYSWAVNDMLFVSPDLQVVWNPFGDDYVVSGEKRNSAITILGLRGHIGF
ncbi:MAG: carbohydrate porin [Candidatus Omnitrophica bacterium]|nr:carbohydrate porin [Candidatus Omnitrophota bacterium]